MPRGLVRNFLLGLLLYCVAGCKGGLHREGDGQVEVLGSVGIPVKGDFALWWRGEGEAKNAALSVNYQHFVRDRVTVTAGLTPLRLYDQEGDTVYQAEFQAGTRYYPWEFPAWKTPVALYGEVLGGVSWASEPIPPIGSDWNLSLEMGLGFEIHLSDRLRWMVGYRLRHLSNGHGNVPENPGQNDHLLYTGLAFPW